MAHEASHGHIIEPRDFRTLIWQPYLEALQNGEWRGRTYWLSYDELLALATVSKVPLVVVRGHANAFDHVGDNLASFASPATNIVISSIRDGGNESETDTHFERLIPRETVTALMAMVEVRRSRRREEERQRAQEAAKKTE